MPSRPLKPPPRLSRRFLPNPISFGLSSYVRLFRIIEREMGEPVTTSTVSMPHFGTWGQWMAPLARTKYREGSYATAMSSIEGG